MIDKNKPYIEIWYPRAEKPEESFNFETFEQLMDGVKSFNKYLATGTHLCIDRSFQNADETITTFQELIQEEGGIFYSIGDVFNFDLTPFLEYVH